MAIGDAADHETQDKTLSQVTRAVGLSQYQARKIAEDRRTVPSGLEVCNGHDLVEAIQVVLVRDYRCAKAEVRSVDAMLRMTMLDEAQREAWSVVKRLRHWETPALPRA